MAETRVLRVSTFFNPVKFPYPSPQPVVALSHYHEQSINLQNADWLAVGDNSASL